jgi:hypothetical protein
MDSLVLAGSQSQIPNRPFGVRGRGAWAVGVSAERAQAMGHERNARSEKECEGDRDRDRDRSSEIGDVRCSKAIGSWPMGYLLPGSYGGACAVDALLTKKRTQSA